MYSDMFEHMDGVMRTLAKKKIPWMERLFLAVKLARQKLSKYYTEVTLTTGMLLISAHILDPFRKLQSFIKWDIGMDINPEDKTSYTTQYQDAFLKYVENKYCANHRRVPVNQHESLPLSNLILSTMASGSCQSSIDPYDLSSDDEGYLIPNNVAGMTPKPSDHAARLVTTARLYSNSPPEATRNWGQINPNLHHYHSNPMEIRSTFWLPDITDWWRQQKETNSKYSDVSNEARKIFSIIPRGVRVEASFSLGQDVIGWRQLKTTGGTVRKQVVARQFPRAKNGILAGADPELDTMNTENNSEKKKEAEEMKLHRMAKVHDFLEMWQGSQNQCAAQKESRAQNMQITAMGYISDMEEIVKALGHSFNMMERLHSNCQKGLLCHHLGLQRTSLEDKLKNEMSTEFEESTVIQSKVTRTSYLNAFRTLKIGLTGMGTYIIQMTMKTILRQTVNLM